MKIIQFVVTSCLFSLCAVVNANASYFDQFFDPKDGKLDMSQWLSGQTGFLPIPLVISDPSVGYGGGLAVAFLHDAKEEASGSEDLNQPLSLPPSISFLAGAGTENGSWLLGGGHVASWKEDTLRYTGVAGYGDFNLKFYGVESDTNPHDFSLDFDIQGFFLLQELIFRIKDSNFFTGARYSLLVSSSDFQTPFKVQDAPKDQLDSNTAGLGALLKYDSRDSIVSPQKGHYAKLEPVFYSKAFGGDFEYVKTKVASYSYWPFSKFVFGVRLEGDFTGGDVPFYDAPYIDIRGIPALRYQGENVVVGELEANWHVTPRWSLVGFVGSGWTSDEVNELSDESSKVSGGTGFRYLLARRYGLRVGLDVAKGPEDTVIYMGIGSSWN